MRTDTKTREALRFAPENHRYGGDYSTDWSTGLRHVCPCPQLAANEGGMVFLTTDMVRDPDARGHVAGTYGIEVCYAEDLPVLYAPGTDRKITKRSLLGRSFLMDRAHHRVLAIDKTMTMAGIRAVAVWTTVMSPARSYTPVYTKERSTAKEKAWKADHADTLLQARAVRALDGRRMGLAENLIPRVMRLFPPGKPLIDAVRADSLLALGTLVVDHVDMFSMFVTDQTADKREYQHLVTKPFGI